MSDVDAQTVLLRVLVQLNARQAFQAAEVRQVVGTSQRQLQAYNLCDGTLTQAEVARKAGLNQGNFSRTMARWLKAGIVFKLGTSREARLLHVYPLPKERVRSRKKS